MDLASSSFDDEFSDNNLVVDFGSFFVIWDGWFDLIYILIGSLFGFLSGWSDSVFKFEIKLTNSTDLMKVCSLWKFSVVFVAQIICQTRQDCCCSLNQGNFYL